MPYGRAAILVLLPCVLGFQTPPVPSAPHPGSSDLQAASDANRFLEEAQAAERRHDDAIAEQKYKQFLSIVKRHNLGAGLESLALRGLGQIESARHNEAAALDYAKQRLDATRKIPGDVNIDLTDVLTEIAALSLALGHETDAERYWKEASSLLNVCATANNGADAYRRCRIKYWDSYGTMAAVLFMHHQDVRAEKMLQEILDAPETEVRPLVLLVALRAQTAILIRNSRAKDAFLVVQRSAAYERDHPEVVAQLGPAPTPDRSLARASSRMSEMAAQVVAGKLPREEDFSAYGIYTKGMQLLHDALFSYQEIAIDARKRIEELDLAHVLSPHSVQDAPHLQTSRERVRTAILEEDRLVVKSQNIASGLERAFNEQPASTAPDERAATEYLAVGFAGGAALFRGQVVEMESYSRQSLTRLDEILAFLERKLGHYKTDGNVLRFDDPEEQDAYEASLLDVRERANKALAIRNRLMEQFQKAPTEIGR